MENTTNDTARIDSPAPDGATGTAVDARPALPRQPVAPARPHATRWSYPWALAPFLTFGMLSSVTIGYAAVRLRSKAVAASAILYLLLFVLAVIGTDDGDSAVSELASLAAFGSWAGGTFEAFALRKRVFTPNPVDVTNRAAADAALHTRRLRIEARKLLSADPSLASELRIGRPDLPHGYQDGGLIDVNQVPAEVLTTIPGITPQIAERIVRQRGQTGPYLCAEDVAAYLELDPSLVPLLAEYTVYSR